MSFFLSTYYNVIIAWAIYYFFSSFNDPLPWKECDNEWNTELCWNGTTVNSTGLSDNKTSAPQEFYEYCIEKSRDHLGKTDLSFIDQQEAFEHDVRNRGFRRNALGVARVSCPRLGSRLLLPMEGHQVFGESGLRHSHTSVPVYRRFHRPGADSQRLRARP